MYPAKTQVSLGIRPVWSESSLSGWSKLGSLATYWAHSEDSDQADLSLRWAHSEFVGFVMRRLICIVFQHYIFPYFTVFRPLLRDNHCNSISYHRHDSFDTQYTPQRLSGSRGATKCEKSFLRNICKNSFYKVGSSTGPARERYGKIFLSICANYSLLFYTVSSNPIPYHLGYS